MHLVFSFSSGSLFRIAFRGNEPSRQIAYLRVKLSIPYVSVTLLSAASIGLYMVSKYKSVPLLINQWQWTIYLKQNTYNG